MIRMHKDMGLVTQVFNEDILSDLFGHIAVGHTRYSTTGSSVVRNAQPIYCTSQVGDIAVVHNGNLINAHELRIELQARGAEFDTTSDSEVIARLIAEADAANLEDAVVQAVERLEGAFSLAILTPTHLIGVRDPNGVRPLVLGFADGDWVLSSESCAFGPVKAKPIREVEPGEVVIVDANGVRTRRLSRPAAERMCMFEIIYFARPDSVMGGHLLHRARQRMGVQLAREHPVEADLVVPVPDTGVPAAIGYSQESGIPFQEALIKSRYIHRTFIEPEQRMRDMGVRLKLNPLSEYTEGKRLVLVDDSIVRGTTTGQIVKLLCEAGATEVHVRITAPPIKFPCFYGIDMATRRELVAANFSVEEIREKIGADSLGYLSVEGLLEAVHDGEELRCLACFTGDYPIPIPQKKRVAKDIFEKVADDRRALVRTHRQG
jgi:amidophosphoribosyltransferase